MGQRKIEPSPSDNHTSHYLRCLIVSYRILYAVDGTLAARHTFLLCNFSVHLCRSMVLTIFSAKTQNRRSQPQSPQQVNRGFQSTAASPTPQNAAPVTSAFYPARYNGEESENPPGRARAAACGGCVKLRGFAAQRICSASRNKCRAHAPLSQTPPRGVEPTLKKGKHSKSRRTMYDGYAICAHFCFACPKFPQERTLRASSSRSRPRSASNIPHGRHSTSLAAFRTE